MKSKIHDYKKNISTMSKKIILLLSVVAVLISCNKAGKNEYIVTGNIKGIDNGKTVTLEVQDETGQLKTISTVLGSELVKQQLIPYLSSNIYISLITRRRRKFYLAQTGVGVPVSVHLQTSEPIYLRDT